MKRIFALILACVLCLAFCACGGSGDNVSSGDQSKPAPSEADTSSAESVSVSADDNSSAAPDDNSAEASSEDETSVETPSESSETPDDNSNTELTVPDYISNFVTWAKLGTGLRATDATSLRLTKVNDTASYGDVAIFTYDFMLTEADVEGNAKDYAYFIAEFDAAKEICCKKEYYPVGSYTGDGILIPEDGFVIAAHKEQQTMIAKLASIPEDTSLYVAGVQTCDVGYSIKETSKPMVIDGVIDSDWDAYLIDTIDKSNVKWTYSLFEKDNYYTNAKYYVTFDKDNLYLAVAVSSPYHYCPISKDQAGSMWQYECIQVKVSSLSPKSDYIAEHYDHVIDPTANNENIVHAYGFAVNDNDETCYYENSGKVKVFPGTVVCSRDDAADLTVYEVAISWSEFEEGTYGSEKIGISFSINSTNDADFAKGTWKNLIMRDGGGVIGRNDWSKLSEVTLVYKN